MPRALVVEIFGSAKQFTKELDRAAGRTRQFSRAAGVAGVALAGGLALGLEKSVKAASEFQSEMALLHTQAGASTAEVNKMSSALLGLASSVGTTPDELAKGLFHLESAGLRGKKALEALRVAAEGAKVGHADLEDVTNALNATIVSGIKGAKNMKQAMGALNATVGAGDMRMQDLASAMGTGVLAMAKVSHVGLREVNAALAVFGDNNIRGSKAGNLLSSTMRVMSAVSASGGRRLAEVGINVGTLEQTLGKKGLVAALQYLMSQFKELGISSIEQGRVLSLAFGGRQAGGIRILMSQMDRLKSKVQEVKDGSHGFGESWAATQKTAQFQTDRFHAAISALEIGIGAGLLPVVTAVTQKFAGWFAWLSKHQEIAKLLVVGLAALAGVLLTVSVATKLHTAYVMLDNAATKAWAAAQWLLNAALTANPIGIVVVALVALGAGLVLAYRKSQTFRDIVLETWHSVRQAAIDVFDFLTIKIPAAFQTVLAWTRAHWPEIATLIAGPFAPLVALATNAFGVRSAFTGALAVMRNTAGNVIGDVAGYFTRLPGRIGAAILDGAKAIKNAVTDLFGRVIGWVKDVLGIGSPSAVFHEIGRNVVQGFVNGIGSMAGVLKNAVVSDVGKYASKLGNIGQGTAGGPGDIVGQGGSSALAQNIGKPLAAKYGWGGGDQWGALFALWMRESGWNPMAYNRSSGATGIPQALPYSKMPRAAWLPSQGGRADAASQIGWGLSYIRGRYGSPLAAWAHEEKYNWYGKGGIFTQPSVIGVGERGPEAVIPLSRMGGGATYYITFPNYVGNERDLIQTVREGLQKIERRTGSSVTAPSLLGG